MSWGFTAILEWLDESLAALPPPVRLALWGALGGAISTVMYAIASPRRRLRGLAEAARATRLEIHSYEGDLGGALPLLARQLGLRLRMLGLTIVPVAIASIPVLLLAAWVSDRFGQGLCLGLPTWLRGWEAPFFGAGLVASLGIKAGLRVH
ncbi:MAG: hypothetical protein QM820_10630 [Minicystis sp.]